MALRKDLYSKDGYAGTAAPGGSDSRSEHMLFNCENKCASDKSLSDKTIRDQAIYSKIIDDIILKTNKEFNFLNVEYLGSKSLFCSHDKACEQDRGYVELEINSGRKDQKGNILQVNQDAKKVNLADKSTKLKESEIKNQTIKNETKYEFVNDNFFTNGRSVKFFSKRADRFKSLTFRSAVFVVSAAAFFWVMLIFSNFQGKENYTELMNSKDIHSRTIEFPKFLDESNGHSYSDDRIFFTGDNRAYSHEIHNFIFESNLGTKKDDALNIQGGSDISKNFNDLQYLSDILSQKNLSVNDAARALSF